MARQMRRQDRKLDEKETLLVLKEAEYGILATVGENQQPYAIPINFVYHDQKIYLHCSSAGGMKIENIHYQDEVCFTVVGKTKVQPEQFGTKYESAVCFGKIRLIEVQEKEEGLTYFLQKYSSDFMDAGKEYIKAAIQKVAVYVIDVEEFTGKAKK